MTGTVIVILFIVACAALGYGAAALREYFHG
jgi:hypothetical protein